MTHFPGFWDSLAPHHASVEDSYFELTSLRRILPDIRPPVLVVGAGQGLIVEELQKRGWPSDGVDLSSEMIRYARTRRGLSLIKADARSLPFADGTYETVLVATGVVDFMDDEEEIRILLREARRIVRLKGKVFVAFYRMSTATEAFVLKVGLLRDNALFLRQTLALYRLNPAQTVAWVAQRAKTGYLGAAMMLLRSWAFCTWQEKRTAFHMQRTFRNEDCARSLIDSAPERQPYRDAREIRNLLERLAIPPKKWVSSPGCHMVQI